MAIKLPDAASTFGTDRPALASTRTIVNPDTTGGVRGEQLALEGEARMHKGEAAGEGLVAQARGVDAQAADVGRQTAIIEGQAKAGIAQAEGNVAKAQGGYYAAEGAAAASNAAAMTNIAKGMAAAVQGGVAMFEDQQKKNLELETSRADANYLTQRVGLKQSIDDATDPDTVGDALKPKLDDLINNSAAGISNPRARELWLNKRQADIAELGVKAQSKQFDLLKDRDIAAANQQLDDLRSKGIEAKDPADKEEILRTGLKLIDDLNGKGYIDDTKTQALKKSWSQGYVVGNLDALTPGQRVMALSNFSGDATDRAMALLRNKEGFRTDTYWDVNHWRVGFGSDTITLPDGTVREVKKGDTVTREDAERDLKRRTATSMQGVQSVVGADVFDKLSANQQAALASIAYNYGSLPGSIAEAAQTGDAEVLAKAIEARSGDNNGVNRTRRMHEAMLARSADDLTGDGKRATQLAKFLPADKRDTMLASAEEDFRRETVANARAAESETRAKMADLNTKITDDLASTERTGQGLAGLTREKVAAVGGEELANTWQAEQARSRRIYEALTGIEELPEGEVDRRLATLEPQPGAPGYAEDMKAYQRAEKKAKSFLDARLADPALAVEALPTVKAARQAAEYEGEGDKRQIKPESAQAIVRARLATQQQLVIQQPMAVTKSEARVIGRQLRFVGEDDIEGLKRVLKPIEDTYGPELAPKVLEATLQHEGVRAGLSVAATEVLHSLGVKKTMPTPQQVQRLDTEKDAANLINALEGTAPVFDVMGAGGGRVAPTSSSSSSNSKPKESVGELKIGQVPLDPEDVRALRYGQLDPKAFDAKYSPQSPGLGAQIQKRMAEMIGSPNAKTPAPTPAPDPATASAPRPYTGGFRVERDPNTGMIHALIPAGN